MHFKFIKKVNIKELKKNIKNVSINILTPSYIHCFEIN